MKCHVILILCLLSARPGLAEEQSPSADVRRLVLQLDDANVRQGASQQLVAMAGRAVGPLAAALNSDSIDLRIWAANTLGRIGEVAAPATDQLTKQLTSDSRDLRAVAARALGRIGVANNTVVNALIERLDDPEIRVRAWSASAIGNIGPEAGAAVPDLITTLQDQPVRSASVTALIRIGEPAVQPLIDALADHTVRFDASLALRQISPKQAHAAGVHHPSVADLESLSLALCDPDRDTGSRVFAAQQLGQIGARATPILTSVFDDASIGVSRAAATACGLIGVDAVPVLITAMQHESAAVRATAADAIAAIGPDAAEAIEDVSDLLRDEDRTVRYRAVFAVRALGSDAAVPALIETMQNPREVEATRQWAVKTLGRTGPQVRETVLDALDESSKDDNYGVRSLVALVMKQLKAAD